MSATGTAPGRGRDRKLVAATRRGRSVTRRWFDEPVHHLRDVRTELLLKLTLRDRAGMSVEPLLDAQAATIDDTIRALISVRDPDLVSLWRREHARAVRRFLTAARAGRPATGDQPAIRLSARNQLRATVSGIDLGEVHSTVHAAVASGQRMTATITTDAVHDLDLAEGDQIVMITKASETIVAPHPPGD